MTSSPISTNARPSPVPSASQKSLICSYETFKSKLREEGLAFTLITARRTPLLTSPIHKDIESLLREFQDVFPRTYQRLCRH